MARCPQVTILIGSSCPIGKRAAHGVRLGCTALHGRGAAMATRGATFPKVVRGGCLIRT